VRDEDLGIALELGELLASVCGQRWRRDLREMALLVGERGLEIRNLRLRMRFTTATARRSPGIGR